MSALPERSTARILALLVAAMLVLTACGSDDDGAATDDSSTTAPSSTTSTTSLADVPPPAPAAGSVELDADPPRRIGAGPVTWTLDYTNVTDAPVTVTFPSAQPGDAVIRTDGGEVVHRWSDGRFFTQAVQEAMLAPGETRSVEFAGDLTGVEPGFYVLELSIAVVEPPEPFEQNLRITAP